MTISDYFMLKRMVMIFALCMFIIFWMYDRRKKE